MLMLRLLILEIFREIQMLNWLKNLDYFLDTLKNTSRLIDYSFEIFKKTKNVENASRPAAGLSVLQISPTNSLLDSQAPVRGSWVCFPSHGCYPKTVKKYSPWNLFFFENKTDCRSTVVWISNFGHNNSTKKLVLFIYFMILTRL